MIFFKKTLASVKNIMYTSQCCGMIALKREVAARVAGFPWSECQVRKLTTSHCTDNRCPAHAGNNVISVLVCFTKQDTHGRVYSHRLSYLEQKVRKGGDFFYGKSSNENYT